MNSAFEALLTEIEGRPDGLDMQDVRRKLNGLRGQLQQVKIKLATLANEYTTLRDEAAASQLAGFIDDATHSEFEGEFDLDDGAHQRLDNELDGHLETVSTASRAREAMFAALNLFQNGYRRTLRGFESCSMRLELFWMPSRRGLTSLGTFFGRRKRQRTVPKRGGTITALNMDIDSDRRRRVQLGRQRQTIPSQSLRFRV